jgi:hypothetical protein
MQSNKIPVSDIRSMRATYTPLAGRERCYVDIGESSWACSTTNVDACPPQVDRSIVLKMLQFQYFNVELPINLENNIDKIGF